MTRHSSCHALPCKICSLHNFYSWFNKTELFFSTLLYPLWIWILSGYFQEKELHKDGEKSPSTSSFVQNDPQLDSQPINGEKISNSDEENQAQGGVQVLFP